MKKILLYPLLAVLLLQSCDYIDIEDSLSGQEEFIPTDSEIVDALKMALELGADSASSSLSIVNGYFKGSPLLAIIPLPDDVQNVRKIINNNDYLLLASAAVGLDQKFDDVIKAMNRAAEDAAKDAVPVFQSAITGLSIADGLDILKGIVPGATTKSTGTYDSTAATKYLQNETQQELINNYAPKIKASLESVKIGDLSAIKVWEGFTSTYNRFLNYEIEYNILSLSYTYSVKDFNQQFMDKDNALPASLDADIGAYATGLALDELFLRVGQEEKKIRKDPFEWAIELIQNVFDWVKDQV